jgi:hypothetical protein
MAHPSIRTIVAWITLVVCVTLATIIIINSIRRCLLQLRHERTDARDHQRKMQLQRSIIACGGANLLVPQMSETNLQALLEQLTTNKQNAPQVYSC